MKFNPNSEQQKAIDASLKGNVILSAGAGSGKTATLSEIVYRLIEEKRAKPSQLLVLTFTDAAAREMKQKIIDKFPDTDREYKDELSSAHIQTFDSFSFYLVKQYASVLKIGSNVQVGDQAVFHSKTLEIISDIVEEGYKNSDRREEMISSFGKFDTKGDSNSKQLLSELIGCLSLYTPKDREELICSLKTEKLSEEFLSKEKKRYISLLKETLKEGLKKAVMISRLTNPSAEGMAESCSSISSLDVDLSTAMFQTEELDQYYQKIYSLLSLKDDDFLENYFALASDKEMASRIYKKRHIGKTDDPMAEKAYVALSSLLQLKSNATDNPLFPLVAQKSGNDSAFVNQDLSRQEEQILSFRKDLLLFLGLAEEADKRMKEYKAVTNTYSFKDISDMAVSLLTDPIYSKEKEEIISSFRFVLVDEYQDTNDTQDAFLNALSEKAHLFVVGDAKQSIYRFRNTKVELFLARKKQYEGCKDSSSSSVSMHNNYRSVPKLLSDINALFKNYMTMDHGGINYGLDPENPAKDPLGAEQLSYDGSLDHDYFRKEYVNPNGEYGIRRIVLSPLSYRQVDAVDREIYAILHDIRKKIDSGYEVVYYDPGKKHNATRKCRYSDFAILIRTKKSFSHFVSLFSSYSIPLNNELDSSLIETDPVLLTKALLSLIEAYMEKSFEKTNWRHLYASVARSYIYFDPRDKDLYSDQKIYDLLALDASRNHPDSNGKCPSVNVLCPLSRVKEDRIYKDIQAFVDGDKEKNLPSHRYSPFSEIYLDLLSFFGIFSKLKRTDEVRDSIDELDGFYQEILQEETLGSGLADFLLLFRNLTKQKIGIDSASLVETKDAVTLMSIHKSKGLEFPIVYLPSSGNSMTKDRTSDGFILSKEEGVLFPDALVDPEHKENFLTKLYKVGEGDKKEDISEEARINYVALTRAKESVYIVGDETRGKEDLFDMLSLLPSVEVLSPIGEKTVLEFGLTEDGKGLDDARKNLEEGYFHKPRIIEGDNSKEGKKISERGRTLSSIYEEEILAPRKEVIDEAIAFLRAKLFPLLLEKIEGDQKKVLSFYLSSVYSDPVSSTPGEAFLSLEEAKELRRNRIRNEGDLLQASRDFLGMVKKMDYEGLGLAPSKDMAKEENLPLYFASTFFDALFAVSQDTKEPFSYTRFYTDQKDPSSFLKASFDIEDPEKKKKETLYLDPNRIQETEPLSVSFPEKTKKERASKVTVDPDSKIASLSYGTLLHECLEVCSFAKKDASMVPDSRIRKKIESLFALPLFANMEGVKEYHEFVYYDTLHGSEGSIDLLLVFKDHAVIVDYKTKDLDDPAYRKQLAFYRENIKVLFPGKKVSSYLLSIEEGKIVEVEE